MAIILQKNVVNEPRFSFHSHSLTLRCVVRYIFDKIAARNVTYKQKNVVLRLNKCSYKSHISWYISAVTLEILRSWQSLFGHIFLAQFATKTQTKCRPWADSQNNAFLRSMEWCLQNLQQNSVPIKWQRVSTKILNFLPACGVCSPHVTKEAAA